MNKNLLTIDNVFTTDDIVQLGMPLFYPCPFLNDEFLYSCCNGNYAKSLLKRNLDKYLYQPFKERFPELAGDIENLEFCLCYQMDDNDKWYLSISKIYFFSTLLHIYCKELSEEHQRLIVKAMFLKDDEVNSLITRVLKEEKMAISEVIREIDVIKRPSTAQYLEHLREKRHSINYLIRNLNDISAFCDSPVPSQILDAVNKDIFLLSASNRVLNVAKKEFNEDESLKIEINVEGLRFLNNYKLIIDYLTSENGVNYHQQFSYYSEKEKKSYLLDSTKLLKDFKELEKYALMTDRYKNDPLHYNSYEEMLSSKVSSTWNKLKNEKLAKKIKLNWELIPSGSKITLNNYQNSKPVRVVVDNSKKEAKLKKAYDLVEEKMAYFEQTNPLFELSGIDTFEGYSAYMYPNQVVVFEKFFKPAKEGRNLLVPVDGEAIYVMNFMEFADLSKYSKIELIQEINDFQNPNVKRIYHTANGSWKQKVDKVIKGNGYGLLDLEQIDTLALQLVKSR